MQATMTFPYWVELISKIGLGVGSLVASLAVIVGYAQYRSNRALQRQQSAQQIYRRYLDLAFQYPRLAEPKEFKETTPVEETHRYEWFVSILLTACEDVIEALVADFDDEWRSTLLTQVEFHSDYLCRDQWFLDVGIKHYSKNLRSLINQVCAGGAV